MLKHKSFFLLYAYSCILCIGALTLSCSSSGDESPNAPTELNLQEDNISSIMQNSESSSSNKDNEFSSSEMTIEQNSSSEIKENSCSSVTQKSISSSSNIDQGLSSNGETIEQSSSSEIVEKKSKFVLSESLLYSENSQGILYLQQINKISNHTIISDTSQSYEDELTLYNMDGAVLNQTTSKIVENGNKTQSHTETKTYKYIDGVQEIAGTANSEQEFIVDRKLGFSTYVHIIEMSVADGEQSKTEISQNKVIKFVGTTEEGSEYILRDVYEGKESQSYIKVILDNDGFKKKDIFYNSDNSIFRTTTYSRLPNAPKDLLNSTLCAHPVYDENSSMEYYNITCTDAVNTEDTYQLEIETSYKIKDIDQEHHMKSVYVYERLFY